MRAMSVDEARALAMACELQALLYTLVERRDNLRIDAAMDLMDGVMEELEALGPDHGKQSVHSLRLLVTEPEAYQEHRSAVAMRSLVRAPWRRP